MLDARDPLRYRSEDLESYSVDLHTSKSSVLLLNKADLLPAALRIAWADYFDQKEVEYVFWSAKAGIDSLTGQQLLHAMTECLHHTHQTSNNNASGAPSSTALQATIAVF